MMKVDVDEQPPSKSETITELAARVDRTRNTVFRWITNGIAVAGRVVKLRAKRVGGRWLISPEAWELFERECNPEYAPLPESPAAEQRRFEREKRELLKSLGL